MSKPEHISVSISAQHNGLVHVLLFSGAAARRRLVLRTQFTYDPDEGTPSYPALLERGMERIREALGQR